MSVRTLLMAAAATPPAASLGVSFMTPSTLDARLTFTRASLGTYFDSSGVMQAAGGNVPRWDYDPVTHALRGLLIEEVRTNVIISSSSFTTGGWTAVATTLTPGQPGAPDGTSNLTRVVETATTAVHYIGLPLAGIAASTAYTLTLYARAQQDRYLQLLMDDGVANGGYATFDLQAGVVSGAITAMGTGVIGTASIQAVGGGTYRCSMTTSVGASPGSSRILLALSNIGTPGSYPNYAGNASNGLLVWGAQLEASPAPTSYIATAGATATRAADVCYLPTGSWYNANTYSLLAECIAGANPGSMIAGIGDATPANGFYMTGAGAIRFGIGQASSSPMIAGAVSKICGTVTVSQVRCCINGGAVGTAGSTTAQTTATRLSVGSSPWGGDAQINAPIRRIAFWPRVLSDTEMRSVTT